MRKREERPRLGRLQWIVAPCALMASALAWTLIVQGCPSHVGENARSTTSEIERLVPVGRETARRRPSREELLREALAGVSDGEDAALGARMQLRTLAIPRPPRGASARFNFGDGKRGWITALPSEQLLTSPAFANGKVFLGGGFASHHFFAFDAYDGELEWALAAPDGGPTAAIVHRGKVIFNTESCTLFVADVETGELLWKRWLGDPLMSQPAAAEDVVLSAYPSGGGHQLGAFRLADGEPVWSIPIPADVIQAPQVSGDSVFFATMEGSAHRVRVRDGHVHWKREVGASSAMWVDRGKVLLTRRVDGAGGPKEQPIVMAVDGGRIVREGERVPAPYLAGESRDRQLVHGQMGAWGNVPGGQHLGLTNVAAGWAFQGSTPAVADGRAYFAVAGEIRAREIETGRDVWTRAYREAEGAQAISPPAVVGSQLVFGTVDGHLYFSDIDTGMTTAAYAIGEPIVFQPIVAQGWVYVATARGNLIALEVGDPALDGWHMWGGNAAHAGVVETAGTVDPHLLASLERPTQGTMRVGRFEDAEQTARDGPETATDATEAPPAAAATREEEPNAEEERPDLPLLRTRVEANVSGVVARVVVTQSFENPHDRPIEALYLFPLPAEAAVDDMEMHIGSRVVRGRIQRRAQARQTYEAARSEGRRAALLEQQRPNLFAQRVANIQPGERIDVRIQYVQMLPFENGQYELAYPMIAPPRFDPSDPGAVLGAPGEMRASSDIDLSVRIDAGMPIEQIASPTHRVDVQRSRGSRSAASVRLATGDRIPNRDFVLRYAVSGEIPRATVLAHKRQDGGFFSLVVQPPAAPADDTVAPRAITFVVDTSSSMKGRPMEHAKAVMRRVLAGLRPTDTFNIVRFSDRVEPMAPAPIAGSRENVQRGVEVVGQLRAAGATEMVPAIRTALESAQGADGERLQIVVLLTDGFIANEAQVLRAIAEDLGDTRLYSVGVGSAVNRFLLERAAEIGRGRAIVATLSEPPDAVASRFFTLVDRPVFTDVDVDWGGLDVRDVYPRHLPDLFAGKPLVVHGRYDRGGTARVKVRGTVNGRRFERVVDVTLPGSSPDQTHAAHATLWARAAVHDRMNRLYLRDDPNLIEEITRLGLEHRMMTQYTSFVAVDETPAEPRAGERNAEEQATPTVSPARSLPGDPEIRIPAPADARAVTVILPFGETLAAAYEPELGVWSARFLVPGDAEDGSYPIEVLVTHADGRQEHLRVWYTVDAAAPLVRVEVVGDVRPGGEVVIRATQTLTELDLVQANMRPDAELTAARAQMLSDTRRVEVRLPDGSVLDLALAAPGVWQAPWRIPSSARGSIRLAVTAVDLAANVRTHDVDIDL